jgi:hypothetical protein
MFALACKRRSKKKGSGDSFSPIITANDLAAGWASDHGDSLYSLVPGGEHELALRGVSIWTRSPAITNPTRFMCATFWSASRIEGALRRLGFLHDAGGSTIGDRKDFALGAAIDRFENAMKNLGV